MGSILYDGRRREEISASVASSVADDERRDVLAVLPMTTADTGRGKDVANALQKRGPAEPADRVRRERRQRVIVMVT